MICPLCQKSEIHLYDQDKFRTYQICKSCELVFVPRNQLITEISEKSRYEAHENDENDEGYIKYLKKIAETIKVQLPGTLKGLDFGCGRSKLLGKLLSPHQVDSYDIYFHPDEELLERPYDFIVLSEVIEHLRNPLEEMLKLRKLSSTFFIKTKFYPGSGFGDWFYKRDITHVQFFNEASFKELARACHFNEPVRIGDDLYLFRQ